MAYSRKQKSPIDIFIYVGTESFQRLPASLWTNAISTDMGKTTNNIWDGMWIVPPIQRLRIFGNKIFKMNNEIWVGVFRFDCVLRDLLDRTTKYIKTKTNQPTIIIRCQKRREEDFGGK